MPSQQLGIITYLRSLTPRPQDGQPNFCAFPGAAGCPILDAGAATDSGEVDSAVSTPDAGEAGSSPHEAGADGSVDTGAAEPDAGEAD
jgi:hypothetical protein